MATLRRPQAPAGVGATVMPPDKKPLGSLNPVGAITAPTGPFVPPQTGQTVQDPLKAPLPGMNVGSELGAEVMPPGYQEPGQVTTQTAAPEYNSRGEILTREARPPGGAGPTQNIGEYGINWGNVVSDPAEQQRILGLARDFVTRNEQAGGNPNGAYMPGFSREQAIRDAAYSYFPSGGGGGVSASGGSTGTGSASSNYSTTGRQFTGAAPTPKPYGDFTAPSAANFEHSPDYQYLLDEARKTRERSAAARGTLLNTGTVKNLQRDAAGIAAGDFQNAFNRSLGTYTTNRDTNQQNWGQGMDQYRGSLDAFRANTDAGLGWSRFDADQAERARQNAAPTAYAQPSGPSVSTSAGAENPYAASEYAKMVAALRQQQAEAAMQPTTRADLGTIGRRTYRGAGQ